jgi:tripartite ATP-independent transporter DctM subunit
VTPELIGAIGLGIFFMLLVVGVPIGVAMGVVGIGGLAVLLTPEAALIKAAVVSFETLFKYELGVLPLFLLMAHLCFSAGASRDFFRVAAKFLGHKPGGLALASIGACAGFGAISGSSLATAATVGMVALPEMRQRNYSPALSTGALAAGGTLGVLIPPSGALIVYGVIAEQSIGKLFTAAIVPGLTQALFYMAAIWLICKWRPAMGPPTERASWKERLISLGSVIDLALLIAFVVGGLIVGWFTPTEAASVGAVGALVLTAVRRKLTFASLIGALHETLKTTGMIYVVLIGALIFSTFIAVSGLTEQVANMVTSIGGGRIAGLLMMAVVLLILGSFVDGVGLMLLTTPIFLPIAEKLGVTPIWFGIFLVRTMEIGFVHPPVGMNVYVIHGLAKDIPIGTIFRGIIPFLITDFMHLALIILVPALTLGLPALVGN